MPDIEKATGETMIHKGVDKPYEADQESNDSSATRASSTANSTDFREHGVFEPERQHQAVHPQFDESEIMKTPASILCEFMDESYFETGLYNDADLVDPTTNFYEADKSSHCTNPAQPQPPSAILLPPTRNNDNNNYSSPDASIRHYFDTKTLPSHPSTKSSPQQQQRSLIIEPEPEPEPNPSVYERLTGCRRTSPTARERDEYDNNLTMPRASGVTWTYSKGPFERVCSTEPKSGMVSPSQGEAGRLRGDAERMGGGKEGVDDEGGSWIPVLPRSENMGVREGEEWDIWGVREGKGEGGGGGRMRYVLGGKGFLRLN
ncbi:MAG: hypothetical protein Q9186_003276 [Xanthomendoza sp. 1 TL-2023]